GSEYLRGHEYDGRSSLRHDLNGVLERVHRDAHDAIPASFDPPLPRAPPPLEAPGGQFDMLTIGDGAPPSLRRDLQDSIIRSVHARVCKVFRDYLAEAGARQHLEKILRGVPEWLRRLDALFSRFEDTMLHSHKC